MRGVDAVVYLVHSLQRSDFTDRDRLGAETVAAAVDEHGVRRLVYLSGLVPDAPESELSAHITSRLEVERILLRTGAEATALRAGVVIGAGSTSFEIIRQIATLFVVQPVPLWMNHSVQPIAVSDVLRAIAEALDDDGPRGAVDIGGPDVLTYPRLMKACSRGAGLSRVRLPAPVAPSGLVGLATALATTAPFHTVTSLIESLHHDMVCRPGHTWAPRDGGPLLGLAEAVGLAQRSDVRRPRGRAALRPGLDPPAPPPRRPADAGHHPRRGPARPPPHPDPPPRHLRTRRHADRHLLRYREVGQTLNGDSMTVTVEGVPGEGPSAAAGRRGRQIG